MLPALLAAAGSLLSKGPANDNNEAKQDVSSAVSHMGMVGKAAAPRTVETAPPTTTPIVQAANDNDVISKDNHGVLLSIARILKRINISIDRQTSLELAKDKARRESLLERAEPANLSHDDVDPSSRGGQSAGMGMVAGSVIAAVGALALFKGQLQKLVPDVSKTIQDQLKRVEETGRDVVNSSRSAGRRAGRAVGSAVTGIEEGITGKRKTRFGDNKMPAKYARLAKSDPAFHREMIRVADKYNLDIVDLYGVMDFETSGTFDPSIKNPGSSASGLIQFMESTARGLGTTTKDLRRMSRAQQMKYVDMYFQKNGLKKVARPTASDLYAVVAAPVLVGRNEETVAYRRGSDAFRKNPSWNIDGDNEIRKYELGKVIESRINQRAGSGMQNVNTSASPAVAPRRPVARPPAPKKRAPSKPTLTIVDGVDARAWSPISFNGEQPTSQMTFPAPRPRVQTAAVQPVIMNAPQQSVVQDIGRAPNPGKDPGALSYSWYFRSV